MTDIPRRIDTLRHTEAEKKISEAMQAVENLPADVRLSDAVSLLSAARDSVADFVDGEKLWRRSWTSREWQD